jgi:Ni/Co efflux regulator RcnB
MNWFPIPRLTLRTQVPHTRVLMKHSFCKRVGKVCALVAASSMLPLLAYADRDKDKDRDRDRDRDRDKKEDKDRDDRRHQQPPTGPAQPPVVIEHPPVVIEQPPTVHQQPPAVPEVNAAWVLVPFVGAVLLLSWRRFSDAKQ